jgi:hypothetical protein
MPEGLWEEVMQVVDDWAMRIAKEAAPEEVDQAPTVARAYLKGGYAKEALFTDPPPRRPTTRSIFGPETAMAGATVFPHILAAIQHNASQLHAFLEVLDTATAQQLIGSMYFFFGAMNFRQAIRDRKEQAKGEQPDEKSAPPATLPPDLQIEHLERVYRSLKSAFASDASISEKEKDRIIGRTLGAMLEDPSGAAEFVREVEKAS